LRLGAGLPGRLQRQDRARAAQRERLRHEVVLSADAADDLAVFEAVGNRRTHQGRHHRIVDKARIDAGGALYVLIAIELVGKGHRHHLNARDLFAPAAAYLATGTALEALGPVLDPETLVRIHVPEPQVGRTQISATVLVVDRFGNVSTNARREHVDALGIRDGERIEIRLMLDRYYAVVAQTFADAPPGELILFEDSSGFITLAISRGDAARLTGVSAGDELRIAQP